MNKKTKNMKGKISSAFPVLAFCAMLFAMAALLCLPLSAQAGELKVKDATGTTDVFTVDNTGKVRAESIGVQTDTPLTQLHVVSESTSIFRGIVASQHNDGAQAPVDAFYKSRGTYASPTAVVDGDYVAWFNVKGHDGTDYQAPAAFGFRVDGPVSTENVPTSFVVYTGYKQGTPGRSQRFTVSSSGDVIFNDLTGSGNAYLCIDSTGKVFRSDTACN